MQAPKNKGKDARRRLEKEKCGKQQSTSSCEQTTRSNLKTIEFQIEEQKTYKMLGLQLLKHLFLSFVFVS